MFEAILAVSVFVTWALSADKATANYKQAIEDKTRYKETNKSFGKRLLKELKDFGE